LLAGKDVEHIVDMLEGLAIVLIGWGVAIEERRSLREMAGLVGTPDDEGHIRSRSTASPIRTASAC
jgi:hypothetical protein